jgi:hypothetical protein
MAVEKLTRAALAEKTMPTTAATPHAMPTVWRRLRLRRLPRYLRKAFVTVFINSYARPLVGRNDRGEI